jgi:hypothetical protein
LDSSSPLIQAQLVNALFRACRAIESVIDGLSLSANLAEISEEGAFFSVALVREDTLELRYYLAELKCSNEYEWVLNLTTPGSDQKDEFDVLLEASLSQEVSTGLTAVLAPGHSGVGAPLPN